MKYNELTLTRAKAGRRPGRGISAGRGKTAGRGTKGQGARKSSTKQGFAGGQTPLHMQLPKLRGFKSKRVVAANIYTGQLDALKGAVVNTEALFKAGLIANPHTSVKLICKGELKSKKTVKLQAASTGAVAEVEKAGGTFEVTERLARPKTSTKKSDKKSE